VLAAGRSTRMGQNKLLTRLRDGRTMWKPRTTPWASPTACMPASPRSRLISTGR
jgi:CTP:molybdopterin cytidylyltransferase MocA